MRARVIRARLQLIRHFKTRTNDIYLYNECAHVGLAIDAPDRQWGKEEGPYARLRALGAGEGDSRFGAAIRENSSLGSEKRVDSRGNGELHRGL